MRRVFVVGVLLAMMLGLRVLQAVDDSGTDPLTLATIGFVVLAAFALAELGGELSLPKVTGYILAGLALGPSSADIMSANVVEQMRMFNTLALGLIATTAGLELEFAGLRRLARTLAATIGVKLVTAIVLVGGGVLLIESQFSLLGLATEAERVGIAVVFAALSLGTSPAIALAVIAETSAKGRIADLVLGAAIVKDVVVVITVAIAVAIARSLVGGGAVGIDALRAVGIELGGSLVVGSVLGWLLIAYLRWVKAEMLLFVAAMVLVVAEVSEALHLSLLLVCIVGGMTVRNFSRYEHDLLKPLQTISLPVFIVFFTNAGAGVDMRASMTVLPLAAAVCVARAAGFALASWVGGRVGGESADVRRLAWLGYLPQAGVTLGILGIAAGEIGGTLGETVSTLGMAMVAINLLAGPVTLRMALRRAGEIATEKATKSGPAVAAAPPEVPEVHELEDPELKAAVARVHRGAQRAVERWLHEHVVVRTNAVAAICGDTAAKLDDAARLRRSTTELAAALRELPKPAGPQLLDALFATLLELPEVCRVALESYHRRVQLGDRLGRRWHKRMATLAAVLTLRFGRRARTVPVRQLARTRLEPRFIELVEHAQTALLRIDVAMMADIAACARRSLSSNECARRARERAERDPLLLERTLLERLVRSRRELAAALRDVDTPRLPLRRVRYSLVDRAVRDGANRLRRDVEVWPQRLDAMIETALIGGVTAHSASETRAALERTVIVPIERALMAISDSAKTVEQRLEPVAAAALERDHPALEVATKTLRPRGDAKQLRDALREAESIPTAAHAVEALVPDVPELARLYPSLSELANAPNPATVVPRELAIRERIGVLLLEGLITPLAELVDREGARVVAHEKRLTDAVGVIELLARAVLEPTEVDDGADQALADAVVRERARLEPLAREAVDQAVQFRGAVMAALDSSYGVLSERVATLATNADAGSASETRVAARVQKALASPFTRWWRRMFVALRGEAARYAEARRKKAAAAEYNPGDIRDFLAERARARAENQGPRMYERLFADAPLLDAVLFVAHRAQLDAIVHAGRSWRADTAAGNAALVVGGAGTGKTSLLQVARTKLGLRRVIAIGGRRTHMGTPLLGAIGRELGCRGELDAIVAALGGRATLVMIDDLHTWIDASPEGLERLRTLLSLIERTGQKAFWLTSMHSAALAVIDELMPLQGWFAQVVRLAAPDSHVLESVIETRHGPTDLTIAYPEVGIGGVIAGLRRVTVAQSYFLEFARRTHGNLRAAIRLWRSHAVLGGETVRVRSAPADALGMPFWPSLGVDALGTLHLLLREGPRRLDQLEAALGAPMARTVRLLTTVGIVVSVGDALEIAPVWVDDVELGLVDAGVIAAEEAA